MAAKAFTPEEVRAWREERDRGHKEPEAPKPDSVCIHCHTPFKYNGWGNGLCEVCADRN